MDETDNIQHRDEVLASFRESLSAPMSERYFDEDFLIEVFDYAGDMGDTYLQVEALMCGARFYPDSEELNERKVIFYYDFDSDSQDKCVEDNASSTGMIWDIMRVIREYPDSHEERVRVLDSIVDRYDDFNDEEVIQLVNLVVCYAETDWLLANLEKLKGKVRYQTILLYEIAVTAHKNNELETAVKMLEELTDLEPFNHLFWIMLAQAYEDMENHESALTAVDYALAITPDDESALLTKASVLHNSGGNTDETVELLKRAIAINPDNHNPVLLLAKIYNDRGDSILASVTLNEYVSRNPEDISSVIRDLVLYRPANLDSLLDRFYQENKKTDYKLSNSEFMWASWAHQLATKGYSDLCDRVLMAYERNTGSRIVALYIIERLFMQHRYDEAVQGLSEYLSGADQSQVDFPTIAVMHLISMIKLGEYDHAEEFCKFVESNHFIDAYTDICDRLQYLGLMKIVSQTKSKLKRTKDPKDWLGYDPLKLWSE